MADFLAALDIPMTAQPIEGEVVVLGPRGLAVSLTPEAARESGRRLIAAAEEAEATISGRPT